MNPTLTYFSATFTTKRIVTLLAEQFQGETVIHDITLTPLVNEVSLAADDLLIVGIPVYAGRVPALAAERLAKFKGHNTPAVIVCVYGNRDYDDALLELKDIVETNGFRVVSAGAFIAQHSIFPEVGHNRPDAADLKLIQEFGSKSAKIIANLPVTMQQTNIQVEGNKPYKTPKAVPLHPRTNKKCNACGACAKQCPMNAIPETTPRKTLNDKCIACGRCITICPQHARHFGGVLYKLAGRSFVQANAARREPHLFY
ncbi:4Fe-4S ferredoxin [Bacteroides sp. 214]|uniref:EFR1 family ferrodoxin n=1 Tax=Bacteroides sp. 214 TaxID=2302935 RepID=UPI0013D77B7B|nr:EFR1 family ferrodoxin [Bacteroides sp. 214]NDW13520.1 4Fe-4S ferredoxin [Bacteroides sp. 214]